MQTCSVQKLANLQTCSVQKLVNLQTCSVQKLVNLQTCCTVQTCKLATCLIAQTCKLAPGCKLAILLPHGSLPHARHAVWVYLTRTARRLGLFTAGEGCALSHPLCISACLPRERKKKISQARPSTIFCQAALHDIGLFVAGGGCTPPRPPA